MELWLDRETFSDLDLKEVGTYRYADHAEDLLISYAIGDGPAQVWDCTAEPIHDARAGEIVRRRTATALSIVKSERSLPEEP